MEGLDLVSDCVSYFGISLHLVGSATANGSWFLKSSEEFFPSCFWQHSFLLISHAHVHEFSDSNSQFLRVCFSRHFFASNKLRQLPHAVFFSGWVWSGPKVKVFEICWRTGTRCPKLKEVSMWPRPCELLPWILW